MTGSRIFSAGLLTGAIGTLAGPYSVRWLGRRARLRLAGAIGSAQRSGAQLIERALPAVVKAGGLVRLRGWVRPAGLVVLGVGAVGALGAGVLIFVRRRRGSQAAAPSQVLSGPSGLEKHVSAALNRLFTRLGMSLRAVPDRGAVS